MEFFFTNNNLLNAFAFGKGNTKEDYIAISNSNNQRLKKVEKKLPIFYFIQYI